MVIGSYLDALLDSIYSLVWCVDQQQLNGMYVLVVGMIKVFF